MLQILFSLEDGPVIETVIIPCARGRTTVCVSSQVGCAMNCQFCFTGRMGLRKHLSTAEIVEQAVFARRLFSDEFEAITNVVFMVSILLKYLSFVCIPMINWASCVTNSIQFVVYIFLILISFPFMLSSRSDSKKYVLLSTLYIKLLLCRQSILLLFK